MYVAIVNILKYRDVDVGNITYPGVVTVLQKLWTTSPPLIATAALMLVVLAGTVVGLIADDRLITGAPAWLKPAKFAASIAIYTVTLAWIFSLLPAWRRTRAIVGSITAVTLTLEIILIAVQAWRGTASHFNIATAFDAVVFAVMGSAIVVQTLSVVAVAFALWRERLDDPALTWALRFGIVITIAGALTGGLMTRPTQVQLDSMRSSRPLVVGAHTVGAPDGGPGLPGTGWSTEHGDIRVAHFVGLHAIQALPLLALVLRRRLNDSGRVRMTLVAAGSYVTLFAILLLQALSGVSVVAPDATSSIVLAGWALATVAAAAVFTLFSHLRGTLVRLMR